jgi:hypothetical protein
MSSLNYSYPNGRADRYAIAAAPGTESVQRQERLVRGTLVAAAPDDEPVKQIEDYVPGHAAIVPGE